MGVMVKTVGSSFVPIGGTSGKTETFSVGASFAFSAMIPTKVISLEVAFEDQMQASFESEFEVKFENAFGVTV